MNESYNSSILSRVFIAPEKIVSVLVKKLAPNDDAGGKHGIVIPVESYSMFPSISGFDPDGEENYTENLTTIWFDNESRDSKLKHYHRYPERRLTRLHKDISNLPDGSIVVIGKILGSVDSYEIHYCAPSDNLHAEIADEFSIDISAKYSFAIDLSWSASSRPCAGKGLPIFLKQFDEISKLGFVKSLRSGDTGIGYTFETLMGVEENNYSGPDFEGIELKCYSLGKTSNKHNLFLKEPKWIDKLSRADRVIKYGYFDEDNKRMAMYSAATARQNAHGFKLTVNRKKKRVYLNLKRKPVAYWTFEILKERLDEKLSEAVFVGAKVKKSRPAQFHYETVTHCLTPFVDSFISIIETGDIVVELRMHINEKGSVRNHGTGFRIIERQLPELYAKVQKLR